MISSTCCYMSVHASIARDWWVSVWIKHWVLFAYKFGKQVDNTSIHIPPHPFPAGLSRSDPHCNKKQTNTMSFSSQHRSTRTRPERNEPQCFLALRFDHVRSTFDTMQQAFFFHISSLILKINWFATYFKTNR